MWKIKNRYEEWFEKVREREIEGGVRVWGGDRDDVVLFVNGGDVERYGCQGEERRRGV